MANVPYNPNGVVDPTGAPSDYQNIETNPAMFGGGIGQALQGFGHDAQQGGQDLQAAAIQRQDMTNELYANDASTEGMKKLSSVWGTYNSLEGRAAHDAWPQFQKQLQETYQQTLDGAPNPQAKEYLSRSMKQMTDYYLRAGQSYADSAWKSWYGQSADARANEFSNQAAIARQDPKMMDAFLKAGIDEVMKPLDASGATPEQRSAAAAKYTGVTVANIAKTKIDDGDLNGATFLLTRYGTQMDAGSRLQIEQVLAPKIREKNAQDIANYSVRGGIPPTPMQMPGSGQPLPQTGVWGNMLHVENGPQDPGAVSSKGAIGLAQVEPATARETASSMGLSDLASMDDAQLRTYFAGHPDVNLAIGKTYYDSLVKRYGGDQEAAVIGYNGGPGVADKWLQAGRNDAVLPDETKDYRNKVFAGISADKAVEPSAPAEATGSRAGTPTPGYSGRGSANYMQVSDRFGDPRSPDFAPQHIVDITAPNGQSLPVNKDAAPAFAGFLKDLAAEGYDIKTLGGYNVRNIRGGGSISQHSFGNAIDVNADNNAMTYANSPFMQKKGGMATDLPANVSDLAAKWGLTWGGDWHGRKDPMHFEWTGRNPQGGASLPVAGNPSVSPPDQNNPLPDEGIAMQRALAVAGNDPELQKAAVSNVKQIYSQHNVETATERQGLEASVPNLIANAEAGVNGVTIPEDSIRRVMPAAKADAWIDEFHIAQQGGQIIRGLRWAPTSDWENAGQDLTSGQGVLSTLMKGHAKYATSGPGALGANPDSDEGNMGYLRLRDGIGKQFMAQYMARNKMLYGAEADPAAYVNGNPTVVAARAKIDPKNPQTYEAYANASLGVQTALGVPGNGLHVLSRGDAEGLAAKITAPGMDAKQSLDNLQKQYGAAFPRVFNDMVTLGKLPSAYQSVLALDDPTDAAQLSRAIMATKGGEEGKKDWDELLGKPASGKSNADQINDIVNNDPDVVKLKASLTASNASPAQVNGIVKSVQLLGYAKSAFGGEDPQTAAANAAKAFTGKFEFMPNGGARVPSSAFDAVTTNAGQALRGMSTSTIAVPPIFGQVGMPSAEEYVAATQANPTWITNKEGNALLLVGYDGRFVRNKDGSPLTIPFSGPATPAAKAPDQDQLAIGTAHGG